MNTDLLKIVAVTAGTLVSAPFVLASMRAFFFFGEMSQTVKRIDDAVTEARKEMRDFIEHTETTFVSLATRVTTIEVDREAEVKYGRRVSDRPKESRG